MLQNIRGSRIRQDIQIEKHWNWRADIVSQYGSQIHNVYDLKNIENTFFGKDP